MFLLFPIVYALNSFLRSRVPTLQSNYNQDFLFPILFEQQLHKLLYQFYFFILVSMNWVQNILDENGIQFRETHKRFRFLGHIRQLYILYLVFCIPRLLKERVEQYIPNLFQQYVSKTLLIWNIGLCLNTSGNLIIKQLKCGSKQFI